ncbi:hypothetical protein UlMin_023305 [Ulmus minor]
MKKLKKQYSIVFYLLNQSGFGWDNVKKCVQVDSNDACQSYVKAHKEADGWRGKPFPLYKRLSKIFGVDRAHGKGAETPIDVADELNQVDINNTGLNVESPPTLETQSPAGRQVNQTQPVRKKKKRKILSDDIITSFGNVFQSLEDAIGKSNENIGALVECLKNKDTQDDNKFIKDELKRMGFLIED